MISENKNLATIEIQFASTVTGLPQSWGNCADQALTGQACRRLENGDGVGSAFGGNRG